MSLRKILPIIFLSILTNIFSACEDEDGDETKISYYDENESHRGGEDCMNCHYYDGPGEYWFHIAGTVYDSTQTNIYPGATVKLYSEPNGSGELIYSLEVDQLGNFYSTEQIDFGNGLYPVVQGNELNSNMLSAITTGRCNSCHGNSQDVIWTK